MDFISWIHIISTILRVHRCVLPNIEFVLHLILRFILFFGKLRLYLYRLRTKICIN